MFRQEFKWQIKLIQLASMNNMSYFFISSLATLASSVSPTLSLLSFACFFARPAKHESGMKLSPRLPNLEPALNDLSSFPHPLSCWISWPRIDISCRLFLADHCRISLPCSLCCTFFFFGRHSTRYSPVGNVRFGAIGVNGQGQMCTLHDDPCKAAKVTYSDEALVGKI